MYLNNFYGEKEKHSWSNNKRMTKIGSKRAKSVLMQEKLKINLNSIAEF